MTGSPETSIAEAMNRLWEKYLPQIEDRIAVLQQAAMALAACSLTSGDRQRAAAEAHKLAGVLGTFGLHDGTNLAREAESLYEISENELLPLAARLSSIAAELQGMIANRK